MKAVKSGILSLLFLVLFFSDIYSQEKVEFPVLKGAYLGQKPPGKTPAVFANGLLSIPG